jgi:putative copper export protein
VIDTLWLVVRALGFVLVPLAAGTALFTTLCARNLPQEARAVLGGLTRLGARLALAVVLAQGLLEPAHLAGEWAGIGDPGLLHLAFLSAGGLTFWLRAAGLIILAAAASPAAALPGALIALASFLIQGHALVGPYRLALLPLLALHVFVASFWFGAVAALTSLHRHVPQSVLVAAGTFSRLALRLVPVLALAGLLIAYVLLPGVSALARPYGLLLCAKVLVFAALMVLAARNRLRWLPGIARGDAGSGAAFGRALLAEYVLLAGVLVVTAVMSGAFSPGPG